MSKITLSHVQHSVTAFVGVVTVVTIFAGIIEPGYTQTKTPKSANPVERIQPPATAPDKGINLTLSPTFINLVANPGEPVKGQMKVTNNNQFPEYLRVDIAKFETADGGARSLISDMKPQDVYKNWVSFDTPEFVVPAGQSTVLNFTVSPPKEAALGYYYAFVVNRVNEKSSQAQGAVVSGSPALLALLEVRSPHVKRELQIEEIKTDKSIYEYLPVTFNVTIKNSGNIHVYPSGDIFIDSMFSKNVGLLHVNDGRGNILPDSSRVFRTSWSDGFAVRVPKEENGTVQQSNGKTEYRTRYDFSQANKFRIGRYTGHLIMAYDNGERDIPLEAFVSFWVIPWKIVGVGSVIIVFALLGLKNTIFGFIKSVKK